MRKRLLPSIVLTGLLLLLSVPAYAANNPTGVTVSPTVEQLTLNKGQDSTSFNAVITNNTSSIIDVNLSTRNFTSLNQTGGLNFNSGLSQPHGLAGSIKFNLNQLVLAPGESVTSQVILSNLAKLSSGGHYAAVIYKVNNATPTKSGNISLREELASLVFISTNGQGSQSLQLMPPIISGFYTTFPSVINSVFKNSGNTQSVLHGLVRIYKGNQLISQGYINTSSGLILPGSERLFNVTLTSLKRPSLLPGRYSVVVNYSYAGQTNQINYKTSFYYFNLAIVPWTVIVLLVVSAIANLMIRLVRFLKIRRKKSKAKKQAKDGTTADPKKPAKVIKVRLED